MGTDTLTHSSPTPLPLSPSLCNQTSTGVLPEHPCPDIPTPRADETSGRPRRESPPGSEASKLGQTEVTEPGENEKEKEGRERAKEAERKGKETELEEGGKRQTRRTSWAWC